MTKAEFTLINESGLHARPATLFEAEAQRFISEITIEKEGESYDAKSIIEILCAAAACGESITIAAEGPDEEEAIKALLALMASFEG